MGEGGGHRYENGNTDFIAVQYSSVQEVILKCVPKSKHLRFDDKQVL